MPLNSDASHLPTIDPLYRKSWVVYCKPPFVFPDRFVRIRYYGLLANRHREQALALCREVLPGPPARPKPPKTDWCDRLQSLTGIDPMRCEVCGQKALRLIGEVAPARAPRAPPR